MRKSDEDREREILAGLDDIIRNQVFIPAPADVLGRVGEATDLLLRRRQPVTRETLLDTLQEILASEEKKKDSDALSERECHILQAALQRVLNLPKPE